MDSRLSKRLWLSFLVLFVITWQSTAQQQNSDAGMWLLPQIPGPVHKALQSKGLLLPESAFASSDSTTLNKAIVRINVGEAGGGTGSFVSSKGLILTNHHVAYDAIASASTADRNFLNDGFIATGDQPEIPAVSFTLSIPIEQVEVTAIIDQALAASSSANRDDVIKEVKQRLITERLAGNPDLSADIDDYWAGNRQFMSVYRIVRDVRIVFAPPSSIGKFGGDIDNWMWPRHTGDFTFLRAYVAPDGTSRPYNEENIPFTPDRFLQVSVDGYEDGDFTMIMGFPGTTYRYESSYDFQYYEESQHPVLIKMFRGILAGLEAEAAIDPELEVATASDRASYANSLKYFEGVYKGFKDYDIVNQRRAQETEFQEWLKKDIFSQTEYGDVLPMLKRGYENLSKQGALVYAFVYTLNNSQLLEVAGLFAPAYAMINGEIPADAMTATETDSMRFIAKEGMELLLPDVEIARMQHFLVALTELPEAVRPPILGTLFGEYEGEALVDAVASFLKQQRESSIVFNTEKASELLSMRAGSGPVEVDPFVQLYRELLEGYFGNIESFQRAGTFMSDAQKKYVKAMLEFRDDSLNYPDANFTLRLTGGRVQNVTVRDTTFESKTYTEQVLEKYTGSDPFDMPEVQRTRIMEWNKQRQNGEKTSISRFSESDGRLVVNFLTTNDITGGNSGSPIMNANGEIIGLAFDGLIESVVADYFHDPKISRTINVDIRYILHVTDELYGLSSLIDEMGVRKTSTSSR